MLNNLLFFSLTILPNSIYCSTIFDWLGWSDSNGVNLTYNGVPLLQIPFEELSPEDKFLVEASKIVGFDLKELDVCQHRIVMKLKSSCGSLSEEELAKFSVNLLNCQSAIEGRKEFPCEEKMTLKDCTKEMDAETWNAYHIMNNRARSVCYAARQQQFRAMAELTVNKLVTTAHDHITALSTLLKESTKLKGGTSLTLNQIEKSQRDVLTRQRSLASLSISIGEEIQQSLTAASGQKQILTDFKKDMSDLLLKLKSKLDNAKLQIDESTGTVKTSHTDLIEDIKEVSTIASQIMKEIDDGSKKVLDNNDVALEQLKATLENMKEINLSIGYILSVVETVKQRSSLISDVLGKNGENIEIFVLVAVHALCVITAMIVSSFLSAPWTSRLVLLATSSLNAYSNVVAVTRPTLNYPRVTLLQFYIGFTIIAVCDWLIRVAVNVINDKKSLPSKPESKAYSLNNMPYSNSRLPDSQTDDFHSKFQPNNFRSRYEETPITRKVNSWLSESRLKSSNLNGFTKEPIIEDDIHSHVSSVARSAVSGKSTDARSICTAISKHTGQRCRKKALKTSIFCSMHER